MGQFTQIQTKVITDKRLLSRDIRVLALIQSMAGKDGYCWPSYKRISEELDISRQTAITAIKKLCDLNYLVKQDGYVFKEIEENGRKFVTQTSEQSSNTYYVNNNPDAGQEKKFIPSKRFENAQKFLSTKLSTGVKKLDSPPVQKLDSDIYKFMKKKCARMCAREKTESSVALDATQDSSFKVVNCPYSSDEIRRLREVREDFKNAFQKDIAILGDFLKTKAHTAICFRFIPYAWDINLKKDFKYSKFLDLKGFCVVYGHFFDEKVYKYDD